MQEFEGAHRPSPETDDDVDVLEGRVWLCCSVCSSRIVEDNARVSFDGAHRHRFLNPDGIEFWIALFEDAPGCGHQGAPTEFFSWFPGYSWRVAVCRSCRQHLGWEFDCIGSPGIGEPGAFHGLIAERLRPES